MIYVKKQRFTINLQATRNVRVLTMMVNSDIIHLCTSLRKIFHGESIKLPEEVHHIIMLPILET